MNIKLLRNFSIFENMNDEQIALFADKMQLQELENGMEIFHEGELGKSIVLLLNGEVIISQSLTLKITKGQIEKKDKSITRLNSDDFPIFGEMTVLGGFDQRSATVTSKTACTLGILGNEMVLRICEKHSGVGYLLMRNIGKILSLRLRQANLDVKKLTTAFSLILED
ncbi:MAG: cyclic nucleotide-binding domain-containing protein [Candidatus Marinimicrobia bacterium]|nr:cyclic nucleotide-binding domain-containing protein [Candidatus Neomarinimicrobiota bacterium]